MVTRDSPELKNSMAAIASCGAKEVRRLFRFAICSMGVHEILRSSFKTLHSELSSSTYQAAKDRSAESTTHTHSKIQKLQYNLTAIRKSHRLFRFFGVFLFLAVLFVVYLN